MELDDSVCRGVVGRQNGIPWALNRLLLVDALTAHKQIGDLEDPEEEFSAIF